MVGAVMSRKKWRVQRFMFICPGFQHEHQLQIDTFPVITCQWDKVRWDWSYVLPRWQCLLAQWMYLSLEDGIFWCVLFISGCLSYDPIYYDLWIIIDGFDDVIPPHESALALDVISMVISYYLIHILWFFMECSPPSTYFDVEVGRPPLFTTCGFITWALCFIGLLSRGGCITWWRIALSLLSASP